MIHTATDRTPYTYVITDLSSGKRYYGCRYAKGCHPSDLWKTYFTSSKAIKKLIKENGKENWITEVRHIFTDIIECKIWEEKVLRRIGVPKNPLWFNQSVSGKTFLLQGAALDLQRCRVSIKMKELNATVERKEKFKETMKLRWDTPGAKEDQSRKIKEYWKDTEWVEKVCQDRKERLSTPEAKEQRSKTSLENWTKSEYIENHKAAMAIVRSNPVWLEANREHMRKAWQNPIKRENMLSTRPDWTDDRREKQSVETSMKNKISWTNPETREKRIAGIKLACAKRKAAKEAALLLSTDTDQITRPCPPNTSLREMR